MSDDRSTAGCADIGGAQIYYRVAGAGHALLLLHAGVADSRMWDAQWEAFSQRYRTIRCDLPGFGQSKLADGPSASNAEIAGLLHALGVERAHVVGCSFGGAVALDLALAYPALVSALVLACPNVGGAPIAEELRQFGAAEEALLERGDLDGATELNLRMWVDGPHRTPDQVDPDVRERVRVMQRHAFTLPIPPGFMPQSLDPPASERLADVRPPTLVVVGDRDVAAMQALGARLEAEIPGARRVVVPGAAHMVSMERPAEFNRLVLDFLAALR